MADKILLPTAYKDVPLTDVLIDDFWYEETGIWTTTATSGTSTGGSSVMTLTTAATDNDPVSLTTGYGTLGANGVWEMTVRFRTHTTVATTNYMIGWLLTSTVGAESMVDDGGGPATGAFCGIYSTDGGGSRWVLCGQGASETRQTKTLDWSLSASSSVWQAVRLRLEANGTDAKLFVFNDNNSGIYYPESASRYGMNNFAAVRGYQDPPQVAFAYLENITLHAAAQSVFVGVKAGTAAASTMSLDYVALAKTR